MTTPPTITPEEALAKVKEALALAAGETRDNFEDYRKALALIPIIEGAMQQIRPLC